MANKVYITGDKHGSLRPFFGLQEKQIADSTDILIITGDAGYVMDRDYMLKISTLEQLFPGTICFIDGNHENHRLLNSFPVSEWQGGKIHRIGERVLHLMRGELYTIHGETYFTFGGARTVSRYVEGVEGVDVVHTRRFGNKVYVDLEIGVDRNKTVGEGHAIAERVHDQVERNFPEIKHIMVHVNPAG